MCWKRAIPPGIWPVKTIENQLTIDMALATLLSALAMIRWGRASSQLTRGRQFCVSSGESSSMLASGVLVRFMVVPSVMSGGWCRGERSAGVFAVQECGADGDRDGDVAGEDEGVLQSGKGDGE